MSTTNNDHESESITPPSNPIEIELEENDKLTQQRIHKEPIESEIKYCCCILPQKWTKLDMTLWIIITISSIITTIAAMRYWSFSEVVWPPTMVDAFKVKPTILYLT